MKTAHTGKGAQVLGENWLVAWAQWPQLTARLSISSSTNDPEGTVAIIGGHFHIHMENAPVISSYIHRASIGCNSQSKSQEHCSYIWYMPREGCLGNFWWFGNSRMEAWSPLAPWTAIPVENYPGMECQRGTLWTEWQRLALLAANPDHNSSATKACAIKVLESITATFGRQACSGCSKMRKNKFRERRHADRWLISSKTFKFI